MVWSYILDGPEMKFNVELLRNIQNNSNENVECVFKETEDLCYAVDVTGASLLHYATEYGNEKITKYLIKSGSDVNLQNKDGNTPLILAIESGNKDIIQVLLEHDADINICNNDGNSPLKIALHKNPINVEMMKLFVEQVSNECSSDIPEIAKKLMEVNCPLHIALDLNNDSLINWMVAVGYDINAKDSVTGKTALHGAVEKSNLKNIKKLLSLGANVNIKDASGKTALTGFDFMNVKNWDILEILVKAKTKLTECDNNGFMQIRSVLENGTAYNAEIILESHFFKVDVTDEHKQNVIHYLAKNSHPYIAEVIDEQIDIEKVDLNAQDENGFAALHCAMNVGNEKTVDYLIKKGASVHILSNDGISPFIKAVDSKTEIEKRARCVEILLMNHAHAIIMMTQYFKIYNTKAVINRDYTLLQAIIAIVALEKNTKNSELFQKIESHLKLKEYFDFCTSELDRMKNEKVYKNVSLVDIIVKNENFVKAKKSTIFRCKAWWIKRQSKKNASIPIYQEFLEKRRCSMMELTEPDRMNLGLLIMAMILAPLCVLFSRYFYPDPNLTTDIAFASIPLGIVSFLIVVHIFLVNNFGKCSDY